MKDVIIKPSDKGGNVVLCSTKAYEREAFRQLWDTDCYRKWTYNPLSKFQVELSNFIQKADYCTTAREMFKDWITPCGLLVPTSKSTQKHRVSNGETDSVWKWEFMRECLSFHWLFLPANSGDSSILCERHQWFTVENRRSIIRPWHNHRNRRFGESLYVYPTWRWYPYSPHVLIHVRSRQRPLWFSSHPTQICTNT